MPSEFSGKIVLVAGGTGGLGRAVSLAFLEQGAQVAVTFRHEAELVSLKDTAAISANRLTGFSVDVTDPAQTAGLVKTIVAQWDRLDVLVNTVGGYAGGTPLWALDVEIFTRMIDLNLRAGFALAKSVVPAMLARKRGAIVNVAAKAAWDHAAGASAYAATKAAAVAMLDSLAADLVGTGVRVNSILPSIIDTAANRKAMPNADFAKWPKAEDIAEVVLFLAGDRARVIHGASVPVFGNG
ncbi:MAG TPA: SDR family NAD(P)-dependent oxidoreductase [Terracidiphilus sp.]|nr:SDR family NAD(P)-dependent oxidoreductase [Terracidiphilus sp.]